MFIANMGSKRLNGLFAGEEALTSSKTRPGQRTGRMKAQATTATLMFHHPIKQYDPAGLDIGFVRDGMQTNTSPTPGFPNAGWTKNATNGKLTVPGLHHS